MATKRIFITGGTGFFGKSMLDYRLRHPEWEWAKTEWVVLSRSPERFIEMNSKLANQAGVSFVAGDIRDFTFPEGHFDAIIHAATSAVTTLLDNEMISVIVDGTRHIIDFANAAHCKTILFTSSGAVYGPCTEPVSEEVPCHPTTAYGKGKLAAEKLLIDSGLDVKIARCFAFVGPHLNRKIHYAIGNFMQDCLDGRDIVIKGDGTPLRSYLYADDLVVWLFTILLHGEACRPYNVGSSVGLSIKEVAEVVCYALKGVNIVVMGKSTVMPPSVYVPNISRAKLELGLREKFSLLDAVRFSCEGATL